MRENRNMSSDRMKNFLHQTGTASQDLENAIDSGDIQGFVQKNLNEQQQQKLQSVLSDQAALDELMNSPQAQKLMKLLRGKQK